jgi:hypothetical protein
LIESTTAGTHLHDQREPRKAPGAPDGRASEAFLLENPMRKTIHFIFALLLLTSSLGVSAMDIQGSHSGTWWNASQSGHGLGVEVLDEKTVLIFWFVYNPDGTSTFLLTVAEIDGDTASGTTFYYSGMQFGEFDPTTLNEQVWGTTSITFLGCDQAIMTYNSTMSHMGIEFGSGSLALTRFSSIRGLRCTPLEAQGNYIARLVSDDSDGTGQFIISGNGDLAYSAVRYDSHELGFGQISMTGEKSFTFEVIASDSEDGDRVYEGTGMIGNRTVTLDLGGKGTLSGTLLPSFQEPLRLRDLAGTYSPLDLGIWYMFVTFDIAADGTLTGENVVGCTYEGTVQIPDPNLNQFVLQAELSGANCSPKTLTGTGWFNPVDGSIVAFVTEGSIRSQWVLRRS